MHRLWMAGSILLAQAWGSALAEPLIRAHTNYYYIHGKSATVLAAQLDRNGPPDANGKRYAGRTRWDVQWKFNNQQQGETCGLKDVVIAVGIAQTLPRWGEEDNGEATALKVRWQKFAEALKRHEDGHKELGLKAGAEIEAALLGVKPASNCEDLGKAANAAANKVIEKYRQQDKDYDRSTDHGRKQGAVLL